MISKIFLFFHLVSSFANAESFFSYSTEILDKSRFKITLTQEISRLDPKVCPNETLLSIAVAEECQKKNFKYFDTGALDAKAALGFCFQSDQRKSLGITFADVKDQLIIENLNGKENSKLVLNDKLLKIDGEKVASIGDVKSVLAQEKMNKVNAVEIQVARDGKLIQVAEPVTIKNQANTPIKDIWAARSTCLDNRPSKK